MARQTYAESFEAARKALGIGGSPRPSPRRPPRHDDDDLGPTLFRTAVRKAELTGATLPGLYVCRTELVSVNLSGSDLRLSVINWSNLTGCDFSGCDLRRCDFRACDFVRCRFDGADLRKADLRCVYAEKCSFTESVMEGAQLLTEYRGMYSLSRAQQAAVIWSDDEQEPPGG